MTTSSVSHKARAGFTYKLVVLPPGRVLGSDEQFAIWDGSGPIRWLEDLREGRALGSLIWQLPGWSTHGESTGILEVPDMPTSNEYGEISP